ncbi:hypothetical protein GmHk_18G052065 [Glycine max]|nr:hypothetical protein GmHk_18G052065 [Glycine max]
MQHLMNLIEHDEYKGRHSRCCERYIMVSFRFHQAFECISNYTQISSSDIENCWCDFNNHDLFFVFAYLQYEKTRNLKWALTKERVFPLSTNFLCQFHIAKNVRANCKMHVNNMEDWGKVLDAWNGLVQSPNEKLYEQHLLSFENMFSLYPLFLKYDQNTWLIPHKEKFVTTWID